MPVRLDHVRPGQRDMRAWPTGLSSRVSGRRMAKGPSERDVPAGNRCAAPLTLTPSTEGATRSEANNHARQRASARSRQPSGRARIEDHGGAESLQLDDQPVLAEIEATWTAPFGGLWAPTGGPSDWGQTHVLAATIQRARGPRATPASGLTLHVSRRRLAGSSSLRPVSSPGTRIKIAIRHTSCICGNGVPRHPWRGARGRHRRGSTSCCLLWFGMAFAMIARR